MKRHFESIEEVIFLLVPVHDDVGILVLRLETERLEALVLVQEQTRGGLEGHEVLLPRVPCLVVLDFQLVRPQVTFEGKGVAGERGAEVDCRYHQRHAAAIAVSHCIRQKMCVSSDVSKNIRVCRSDLFLNFLFFKKRLLAKLFFQLVLLHLHANNSNNTKQYK